MAVALYYAKVVYNANGGSGAPAAQTGGTETSGGSVLITLSSSKPSRQYYTFNGWAYSSGASSGMSGGTTISCNASTTLYVANARVTNLYATWKPETAVLSYNANGGTGAPASQTVNKNTWFTLRTGVPTRSGYEFVGWNTSSTATAATYQPGDSARIVGNMTLYAVWKVSNSTISTITSSVPMDGSTTGTVTISTINASYSHTLTIALGSSSQTINIAAGTTTKTFTIPSAWVSEVPNATSATATATLKTYDGATQIGGSDTKTFTVTVPASVVPSLTVAQTIVNSNATVAGWGILLQNYSQLKLTATATAGTGATVASYTFSGDGMSYSGSSNEQTSAVLTSSGSRTWTVKVTDSRGRTATVTSSATVHEYASPVISSLTAFRADSGGNRDDAAGTYIKATGVFEYSSCDSHNSLSVDKIEYQAEDAGSWTVGQNNAASGTAYTFGGGSITETKTFHVKLTLTDALGNSADFTVDIAPIVGYGFGLKNDRVHFGGPCKEPGFVCDFDTKFLGVVDVVPRRAYATLSSSGWYRVLRFTPTSPNASYDVQGALGAIIPLYITRRYHYDSAETHKITFMCVYNNLRFVDEQSDSGVLGIDKIRYTMNDSNEGFIDIHYNLSRANQVGAEFEVYAPLDSDGNSYKPQFEALGLTSVNDAPSGETILTTYNFHANTSALNSTFTFYSSSNNTKTITIPMVGSTWQMGLAIGNVNGAGNFCCGINIKGGGQVTIHTLGISGTVDVITASISGNSVVLALSNTSYTFKTLTVIGLF